MRLLVRLGVLRHATLSDAATSGRSQSSSTSDSRENAKETCNPAAMWPPQEFSLQRGAGTCTAVYVACRSSVSSPQSDRELGSPRAEKESILSRVKHRS
ncbi:hypothetical protein N657DRAFT_90944 [Parathielavia appendiculata]|uniref:Uncharacterized protein n=1 Tax=Parathielavia appendiculata TaxID=2587402 RepID=A0AAN6UDN7_9PEZI|nr:hypothetical protein N657DRAFT_90944 [Parathielavia appendiculata]